jgi:HAD superfamily hydrolase (TIGR01549 family)
LSEKYLAIFDLDGTLLNTSKSISDALIETLKEFELPSLDKRQIMGSVGLPLKSILSPLQLSDLIEERVTVRFREILLVNIHRGVETFPGVDQFVKKLVLKSAYLGVATTKPTLLAKESMKFSRLNTLKFSILGSDGLKPKPNPEVILKLIAQHPPVAKAVMFGDRVEDMQAASAAGILSVGIAQSAHSKDQLLTAGAILVFNNFEEANHNFEKVFELFTSIRHVP